MELEDDRSQMSQATKELELLKSFVHPTAPQAPLHPSSASTTPPSSRSLESWAVEPQSKYLKENLNRSDGSGKGGTEKRRRETSDNSWQGSRPQGQKGAGKNKGKGKNKGAKKWGQWNPWSEEARSRTTQRRSRRSSRC